MADDTRQGPTVTEADGSVHPLRYDTSKPFTQKSWEDVGPTKPPQSANIMPGGTANTADGRVKEVGLVEGLKTVRIQDFKEIHTKPCVRDAFLTGIGGGFAMGGLRAVFGTPIAKASNWAVGTFCFASFGMYQFCQIRRQMEKEGMRRAVTIMDRKKIEKEEKMQRAREARRKAKEEADRKAEEAQKEAELKKNSWKFW
ncbi:hypothetical protein B0A49_01530 [Cryomyces minteri]|uniref:Cytochrome c oxidase assembly protein COX20, mitochondrial n=1 Tax=Cryomyces minteri TaxID=331657 RepID=A0A4U0XPF5_9PEZI|nr:hypothetical protein B0A49_01530 [Cryomyces minteri]